MLATRELTDLTTGEMAPTEIMLLDPNAPSGVSTVGDRIDAIATLSLGGKSEDGSHPVINRDCRITLHIPEGAPVDQADALKLALEATDYKRLTMSLASNDPSEYLHQWFARYKATTLEAFGDATSVTVCTGPTRQTFVRGDDRYLQEIKACKAIFDIYFILAAWDDDGQALFNMDDGLSLYRIRTTSRNSIRAFASQIKMLSRFTGGRVAGIPINVWAELHDVMTPDSKRQKLPIWQFRVKPPGGIHGGRELQMRLTQAVQQGEMLQLAAPRVSSPDEWDEGTFQEIEPDVDEPATIERPSEDMLKGESNAAQAARQATDRDAQILAEGGLCDFDHWNKTWHATVKGSPLAQDDMRAGYLTSFTMTRFTDDPGRHTSSLSEFLHSATEADANALIAAADMVVQEARKTQPQKPAQSAASSSPATQEQKSKGKASSQQQAAVLDLLEKAPPSRREKFLNEDVGLFTPEQATKAITFLQGTGDWP